MCPPGPLVVAGPTLTRRRWRTRQDANTIAAFDMEHLDTFLAGHPPFHALAPDQLSALAATATARDQAAGDVLPVEDGAPACGLWLIAATDASVHWAAQRLGQDGVQALLVRLPDDALGILTDADVRAAVSTERMSPAAPVRDFARAPAPTVPMRQLAIEATVDMLAA